MAHLHCPSGASLRYAVCHTPCYSCSLRSGSYLCPSCHFILYVLRSTSFHHVRSWSPCYIAGRPGSQHTFHPPGTPSHFAALPTILTGFHFATLRPPLISVAFSPPAAHYLACLAACHSYGFVMVFVLHTSLDQNKNTRQTLASHCCCLSPLHGFLVSTVAGARSRFRSFLPPAPSGGTPPGLQCGQVCHTPTLLLGRRRYYLSPPRTMYSRIISWHDLVQRQECCNNGLVLPPYA